MKVIALQEKTIQIFIKSLNEGFRNERMGFIYLWLSHSGDYEEYYVPGFEVV
jgi:hypothetical protein